MVIEIIYRNKKIKIY